MPSYFLVTIIRYTLDPNGKVTEYRMELDKWQAKGNDPGTTANKWPSDEELLCMVKKLLSIKFCPLITFLLSSNFC